ncbi:MAG: peptidase T [Tenericutes bacterium GWC2_34_14]|nr:MAG: peptidase T [Tenericutes bacterium GWA2_35_7]OHE28376.1 MAG: peptidase T [Tenericutes bacterium GWC2_34_14]OHE33716.1 MAG: peptidase T [Tenericutes bacterium GWE2_34_108]OHE37001.1 MAG: peptidase T [Tenericutes bacterium GWF1_35_14]OHE37919.1 MAG: peptidase T [Tenericutes bacterium GWF2_35_184]OHE41096.1 MAG: peptidase T [Tenericutes bacterium RIFOXYA12_FULL_35_10]OHE43565.1 MAG: peptidase T [Tenericutes bacterium RIFOXYA2_FULL_36_32]OHE46518.1 MAG: peptidase T [Tenericutes bacterium
MNRLVERFLRYVKVDTQSSHETHTHPSTEKQKNLSRMLVEELKAMGLDAFMDDFGYTYAKIDGNQKGAKAIGLIAHVDTSPDAPGLNVNPRIIKKYDGSTIHLNDQLSMAPAQYPSLARVIGDDIIVTDGNTLLGADDKCGVAEIMEVAEYFQKNKDVKHGDIYICFTPDEEIGEGADHFNYDWFKADFAYTADGDEVGGIEFENFNAASADVHFVGKSIHPGSAKNKMINALHLAMEFHNMLPTFKNPAYTEGYEGFNHLTGLKGEVEHAHAHYIIRNHDMAKFTEQKQEFETIQTYLNSKYGYQAVELNIKDSYFNMYEVIKDHMYIVDLAKKAVENVGVTPFYKAIRGGTDGARLTYEGLLCPNIGTGGYQFHGRMEFASINQMEKAVNIFIEIVKLAAEL